MVVTDTRHCVAAVVVVGIARRNGDDVRLEACLTSSAVMARTVTAVVAAAAAAAAVVVLLGDDDGAHESISGERSDADAREA